jgi:uncharacterized protein (TIGR02996 family)
VAVWSGKGKGEVADHEVRKKLMTHDDAFLQAIIESPDDDSLRLIYADFLDERGDPRGEFIRVQVTLANSSDQPRKQELEARERELLKRHEQQWVTPVRPWVKAWAFRRGFVEDIKADLDTVLANADKLFAAAPLRRLTFTLPLPKPAVKHVIFPPKGPLHRQLAKACPLLARLSEVDWTHNHIGDRGLDALANSPIPFQVCRLNLHNANIGDAGVAAMVSSMAAFPRQRCLRDLETANIGDSGFQAMASSTPFPRLTTLILRNNPLGRSAAEALANSRLLAQLADLDLSYTAIGDGILEALARSRHVSNLTTLRLTHNGVGNTAARALAESPYLCNLKILDFRWSTFRLRELETG